MDGGVRSWKTQRLGTRNGMGQVGMGKNLNWLAGRVDRPGGVGLLRDRGQLDVRRGTSAEQSVIEVFWKPSRRLLKLGTENPRRQLGVCVSNKLDYCACKCDVPCMKSGMVRDPKIGYWPVGWWAGRRVCW